MTDIQRGIRAVQTGMIINAALAAIKLGAGIVGNTYALVADAVESGADVFASLLVWGGLAVATQPADEAHPYGYGRAEALAAAAVISLIARRRGGHRRRGGARDPDAASPGRRPGRSRYSLVW